jgi:hypothetical protein
MSKNIDDLINSKKNTKKRKYDAKIKEPVFKPLIFDISENETAKYYYAKQEKG